MFQLKKPRVTHTRIPVNSRNGLIPKMGVLSGRHLAVSVRIVPGLPSELVNLSGLVEDKWRTRECHVKCLIPT